VILPPLPYQITGSDFLVNHPARRAALFDEPGVGKTAQTIFAMDKARVRRAVIVAPAGVHKAGVWQGEFKKFASQPRRIIKHRDVNDLKLWLSGRADVLLMSYEAATKYAPKMKGDLIDAVVYDECVSGDAVLETADGPLTAEALWRASTFPKLLSYSFANKTVEAKALLRVIRKPAPPSVTLTWANGELTCAENHRLWTDAGWVPARDIRRGDRVQVLRGGTPPDHRPGSPEGVLHEAVQRPVAGDVRSRLAASVCHGDAPGASGAEKSDARATSQNVGGAGSALSRPSRTAEGQRQEEGADVPVPRGQRPVDEAADRLGGSNRTAHGIRHFVGRRGTAEIRVAADALQGRLGGPEPDAGGRSGRGVASHTQMEVPGPAQDRGAELPWLDSVEVLERRSHDGPRSGREEDRWVYDFEVEDNHNYFANGVLSHNCHFLKTPDSARTLAAFGKDAKGEHGLARWGVYNWFLSGTPAPNEVFDIWTWLRYVGGTPLNMAPFKARYFKTRPTTYGETAEIRKEALAELQMAISAYSIRRTAKGVGLDLPPIWYTTVSLDGDTREIAALLRQYPNLEPMIVTALEQGGLSKLDAPHIATLRRLIAEAKAPAYVELLDHELRNGLDKVVIMGLHTRALSLICDELAKRGHVGIRVDGTVTSDKKRTAGVKAFQEDPEVRFAACNMMAAGVGLTMTAGAALDLFEEAWTPATNAQAIKRVHRYGQTRKVRARFISLANSLDQHVSETNARKTAQITQLEEGIAA
jgi:hypothetical protein